MSAEDDLRHAEGQVQAWKAKVRECQEAIQIQKAAEWKNLGACELAMVALTPRQRELAALLCRGLGDNEIAELMGIDFKTVKTYLKNISLRMGLRGVNRIKIVTILLGVTR